MRTSVAAVVLCSVLVSLASADEVSKPPARPVRLVIASGKVASVTSSPVGLVLLRVTVPAGAAVTQSGSQGFLYVLSGAVDVLLDGERRRLGEGDGVHVAAGSPVTLRAATGTAATLLHFSLASMAEANALTWPKPATVAELHRPREPLPQLANGPHEFTLTRVTSPAKAGPPPMHHRSGAALYYVLAGSGMLHQEGKSESRGRGAVQLEPHRFVHTWENVGDVPLILLQANISPEGAPEIIWLR
jgi:mannose-6-phosphate isomerase-like protein (cupin superfamily)